MKYIIWDGKNNEQVGSEYISRRKAESRADKLDLIYGAYRYYVKVITNNC